MASITKEGSGLRKWNYTELPSTTPQTPYFCWWLANPPALRISKEVQGQLPNKWSFEPDLGLLDLELAKNQHTGSARKIRHHLSINNVMANRRSGQLVGNRQMASTYAVQETTSTSQYHSSNNGIRWNNPPPTIIKEPTQTFGTLYLGC